jgi:metal-responsive CopG/Arc/MetJ family transcriptional regulator
MEAHADLHVAIPRRLARGLDRLARKRRLRRSQLVRQAIAELLQREDEEQLRRDLESYVAELAPHSGELVRETGAHTVERLLRETEW